MKTIGTTQDRGAHSSTMQMCVSLGEESSGAVVEKHMGLGHSNVHLGRIVTIRYKSSPNLALFFVYIQVQDYRQTGRRGGKFQHFKSQHDSKWSVTLHFDVILWRAFHQKSL